MVSRRFFLQGAMVAGCSAAAHPLLSTATFAAVPSEKRLVVIILRGAMDGLELLQPYGEPNLRQLRPTLSAGPASGAADLDGFFALHPKAAPLLPLWAAGELGFVQACSTPYRDKRSHFDGQDLLEAGTGPDAPPELLRAGWLNRLLATFPQARAETAYSVGVDELKILSGPAPSLSWAPEAQLRISPQAERLLGQLYQEDALFHAAAEEAIAISRGAEPMMAGQGAAASRALAEFAAQKLLGETRIAAFSLGGWDTHRGQGGAFGNALERLTDAILALKQGLGGVWQQTAVLAVTEFGRTVAENGTNGTDHGTGGAMVMAGGALRGGRVYGAWPGLADLYAGRDLVPTSDVRAWAAWVVHGLYGTERSLLEQQVFAGLDMGANPKILL